jgi:hypothetical protein
MRSPADLILDTKRVAVAARMPEDCPGSGRSSRRPGDIRSITVLAANNMELAIGIKGQPCIGEP